MYKAKTNPTKVNSTTILFFCCFATGICKLIRMWENMLRNRQENATWDLKSFQPTLISKSFNAECISEDITPWTYMLRLFETFSIHFNYTNWSKKWNLYIIGFLSAYSVTVSKGIHFLQRTSPVSPGVSEWSTWSLQLRNWHKTFFFQFFFSSLTTWNIFSVTHNLLSSKYAWVCRCCAYVNKSNLTSYHHLYLLAIILLAANSW